MYLNIEELFKYNYLVYIAYFDEGILVCVNTLDKEVFAYRKYDDGTWHKLMSVSVTDKKVYAAENLKKVCSDLVHVMKKPF